MHPVSYFLLYTHFALCTCGRSKVTDASRRLAVTPRKGKAILWANMKDEWHSAELAAAHTALPVRRGVKWAATIWVHAHGFRIPEIYAGRACHARMQ